MHCVAAPGAPDLAQAPSWLKIQGISRATTPPEQAKSREFRRAVQGPSALSVCAIWWYSFDGRAIVVSGGGRIGQLAMIGRPTMGSPPGRAAASSVLERARCRARSSFCASRMAPSFGKMPTPSAGRLISPLRRSRELGERRLVRRAPGKDTEAKRRPQSRRGRSLFGDGRRIHNGVDVVFSVPVPMAGNMLNVSRSYDQLAAHVAIRNRAGCRGAAIALPLPGVAAFGGRRFRSPARSGAHQRAARLPRV